MSSGVVHDGCEVPETLSLHREGAVGIITLSRPAQRNAFSDITILGLERIFTDLLPEVRAIVLDAAGDHFCAGLDLAEMAERDTLAGVAHSRLWHRAFETIEDSVVPVVSVLKGAVVGGGLELASATHVRVVERSTFYALPEGQRGLFVGGCGSVRVPRLVGAHRMVDMMLTGRRHDAVEGHAVGFAHYLVDDGAGLDHALGLAARIADNAPQTNFGPPIGEFQGVAFMLADMEMRLRAARLLTYAAAEEAEAAGPDMSVAGATAKRFAPDAAMSITVDAVQVLGGAGYTADFPVERMMRDAEITQIYEGTNQIQRIVVSRALLGAR
ncbi:crotonase/enoyl-CoA hydratase family protein [Arsenicicoccus cauae]|uniref:crotonase/enoyl-CoA hydratase family protein n=1 Tax=Arsenicicoccus cauae TaxID=2663847 RepID=UPI00370DAD98